MNLKLTQDINTKTFEAKVDITNKKSENAKIAREIEVLQLKKQELLDLVSVL